MSIYYIPLFSLLLVSTINPLLYQAQQNVATETTSLTDYKQQCHMTVLKKWIFAYI
jgi:hypothetical protein